MNSVVVCAYTTDRWDAMCESVESVRRQSVDDEVVLVIDHNDELLARSRARWADVRDVTVVANRFGRGLSGARNTGVTEAAGDIVAFLDDDAIAEPGWLAALTKPFADPAVGGVGGKVLPMWSSIPPKWLPPEFWWVVGCSYVGQPEEIAQIRNPIGANMAFRRSVFDLTGGFREEVGRTGAPGAGCEETELSIRAGAAGFSIWYEPSAVVRHLVGASRTTLAYFLRRCFMEGRSKATVSGLVGHEQALSAERDYVRVTLPAGIVRGLRQLLRGPDRLGGLAMAATICIGVAATGIGFLRGMISARWNRQPAASAPRLPMSSRAA
jgi:GT2 family glycosyltransferase